MRSFSALRAPSNVSPRPASGSASTRQSRSLARSASRAASSPRSCDDALPDADQPEPAQRARRPPSSGSKPIAVVLDRDQHGVRQPLQVDAAGRGLRVLGHVGQRLLHDAIDAPPRFPAVSRSSMPIVQQLDRGRRDACRIPSRYHSIAAGSPRSSSMRRMEQARQIAHRVQRAVGDRPRVVAARSTSPPRGVDRALRDGQFDLDRGQHLSDLVVQLARDAAAFLLLRGEQLCDDSRWRSRVVSTSSQPLPLDALLEPAGVERGQQRDRRGWRRARDQTSARRAAAWRDRRRRCPAAAARTRCGSSACTSSETAHDDLRAWA